MKRNCVIALTAIMLMQAMPAQALDPASVQAYCDQVKKAGLDAQTKYLQVYQPRVDPVKTFDDATMSCLDAITNMDLGFGFSIPGLGDIANMMKNLGNRLMQRACQAASAQYQRAVSDAMNTVNQTTTVPGIGSTVGAYHNATGGVTVDVSPDVSNSVGRTVDNATDRVINFLR